MATDTSPSPASISPSPLHAMLSAFPFVCFIGALLTDLAYVRTYDMQWANFSIWLLTAGLVMGGLAVLVGLIDLRHRRARATRPGWLHGVGTVVALVLALVNAFVHSRDAYTSVVPAGLMLSILTVIVMVVTTWFGGSLGHRHSVEVTN